MESTIDRSQAYQIRVPQARSAGELHVGWRSYPIQVMDMSWQAITFSLSSKNAKAIRKHSKVVIWNQGNQWQGFIDSEPQKQENGISTLTLQLSDENDPRLKKILNSAAGKKSCQIGEQRVGTDPVILGVFMVGIILILLVTPGWGDDLGTSEPLTQVVTELVSAFKKFFSSLF